MERTQPIDSFLVSCNLRKNYKLDTEPQKIAGSDIMEGNQTLTLALVWQLMRAYTLSLLAKLSTDGKPVTEAQIIEWANKKVEAPSHPLTSYNSNKMSPADGRGKKLSDQGLQGQIKPNSNGDH